jgi:hypothetical protein|tara:strand:+ start:6775 stop:8448 length:1674 start_codon:yes stop_codon:yes gene_type:complete
MSKSGLDKLIEQVLVENVNWKDIASAMNQKIPTSKAKPLARQITGQTIPGGNRSGEFYKYFQNVASEKPSAEVIDKKDLKYYIDNPTKIDTKDEYVLGLLLSLSQNYADVMEGLKDWILNKGPSIRAGSNSGSKNILAHIEDFVKLSKQDADDLAVLADQALQANQLGLARDRGEETISKPTLNTQEIEAGKLPSEYEDALKNTLGGAADITQRLTAINKVSKKFLDAYKGNTTALDNQPVTQTLSEILILDLFNLVYKQVDSGSGAYYFEAILAFIAGGKVLGKLKTDAGKMGAADFSDAYGGYGSAKFYGLPQGITQAANGFRDLYGKHIADGKPDPLKVTYAVAIKKEDVTQFGKAAALPIDIDPYAQDREYVKKGLPQKAGTSDPARIMASEIFMPVVEYTEVLNGTPLPPGEGRFKINGQDVKPIDGDIVLDKHLGDPISPNLFITSMRTESFREYIEKTITNQKGEIIETFKYFKGYFDELTKAEKTAKKYSATGVPADANVVQDHLISADSLFASLRGSIDKDKKTRGIVESKSPLDGLIESIIKKKLLK